ncbi:MAG: hypothetical protein ABF295_04210 [Flavobacteriaceae bacterium]
MNTLWKRIGFFAVFTLCLGCISLMGQQETKSNKTNKIKVKKHTVLAQYEPELVTPADERRRLKYERLVTIKERREIIDTLDISDRKRKQLLKELYRSPFSYKWDKVIAEIQAEDEDDNE